MSIKNGPKVSSYYTLKVEGQVSDSSGDGEPFQYVHGTNGIVPGLEGQLDGLEVGDKQMLNVGSHGGLRIMSIREFLNT